MTRPRIVFLVTEDWYFWAHRLPQARAARDAGFDVHVATRVDQHRDRIAGEGFTLHALSWSRGSIDPVGAGAAVAEIANLYRALSPDLVHHVSQKSILFGSLAARIAKVRRVVNAFTGLGLIFAGSGMRNRMLRVAIGSALKTLIDRPGTLTLVENPDDAALLTSRKLVDPSRVRVIRGSGVDLTAYDSLPVPVDGQVIGLASRLLRIKGIDVAVAAQKILRARGYASRLLIAGAPDGENAASFTQQDLAHWRDVPGVELLGKLDDVRSLWQRAAIGVLPSRGGEGIPMSLLEAAACARPLVATDVPGCREIVRNGVNGTLVPVDDADALANALMPLLDDSALRERYGAASRALVESDLAADAVGRATVAVYRELLASV
ncbi:glycosyltransferase family 4 protein [Roseiterribacter gracilis]|uniref:Glycosyl transferase family 1 n=1 Tax=Roseiterribacter gracilis TaxID=2812848 RepID=A0A8S8X6F5_9PROT|nr:glycosyl transferase family 1 [Rhodospirillales bacterium TMPK1]